MSLLNPLSSLFEGHDMYELTNLVPTSEIGTIVNEDKQEDPTREAHINASPTFRSLSEKQKRNLNAMFSSIEGHEIHGLLNLVPQLENGTIVKPDKQEASEDIGSAESTSLESKTCTLPQPDLFDSVGGLNEADTSPDLNDCLISEIPKLVTEKSEVIILEQPQEFSREHVKDEQEEHKLEAKSYNDNYDEIADDNNEVINKTKEKVQGQKENKAQAILQAGHLLFLRIKVFPLYKWVFINMPTFPRNESFKKLLKENGLYFRGCLKKKYKSMLCNTSGFLFLSRIFQRRIPKGEFQSIRDRLTRLRREQKKYRFFIRPSVLVNLNIEIL